MVNEPFVRSPKGTRGNFQAVPMHRGYAPATRNDNKNGGPELRRNLSEATMTPEELERPEMQIARALVQVRREKHITQQQLAEKTGIAQADISRLENGNSNPSLRTLQRLADGLGMKIEVGFKES